MPPRLIPKVTPDSRIDAELCLHPQDRVVARRVVERRLGKVLHHARWRQGSKSLTEAESIGTCV